MKRQCGIMLSETPFPNMPIILKKAGLDFFVIDCEHGGFDYSFLMSILTNAALCGIDTIVRLPDNSRRDIIKFLDMGAGGLLLPMTNTASDIKKVVEYAKYSPMGKRGISTMRAHTLYDPPPLEAYMRQANERVKVFAQIETLAGVENLSEILSVEGVSGCIIGPNDLACDIGCIGKAVPDDIIKLIEVVARGCENAKKTCGIITNRESYIKKAELSGIDWFCIGSELSMLSDAAKRLSDRMKKD